MQLQLVILFKGCAHQQFPRGEQILLSFQMVQGVGDALCGHICTVCGHVQVYEASNARYLL